MSSPLHILVSNDDGIDAPGIYALVRELRKVATVSVVAPDKQQSAVGHAITMNYPLRAIPFRKNDEFFGPSGSHPAGGGFVPASTPARPE